MLRLAPSDLRGALKDQLGQDGYALWLEETVRSGPRGRRTRGGPIVGLERNIWLSQWIVAYPEPHVVAVRLISRRAWREARGFGDFIEVLGETVRADR